MGSLECDCVKKQLTQGSARVSLAAGLYKHFLEV